MSKIEVKGLQVLCLYVSDLDRSVDFYAGVLGFTLQGEMPPGLTLRSGDLTLYLEPGRVSRETGPGEAPEFSPCFETSSVRESYQTLMDLGVRVFEEYVEYSPDFAIFKILDPDGNIIEFAGRP